VKPDTVNFVRTVAFVLFLGLSACATFSSSESGGESKAQLTIPVNAPPPPDKPEGARPGAPGFGFIWVAGYWDYLDGNYIWRDGRWVQGKPDYEYVRARYEYDGKTLQFHRPHWKRRAHQAAAPAGETAPN
jgi:hypothetical protein